MLFDIYHVQIHTGNIIPNIDLCWDETVYVQLGDNPGRKNQQPVRSIIKIFSSILIKRDTRACWGMEHGNSIAGKEGELALIKAYREVDSFK